MGALDRLRSSGNGEASPTQIESSGGARISEHAGDTATNSQTGGLQ
jgi:hypothetical protein